jgi:hypothetical protein
MKNFGKNILFSALVMIMGLTSCFDEKEDEYSIVGAVGSAVIITTIKDVAGNEKPLVDPPAPGDKIFVNVRYYSENITIRQVKFSVAVGTGAATELWTIPVTDFDRNNSYEHKIEYTVPTVPSKTAITFTAEVLTVNELTNTKTGIVTVK